MLLCCLAAPELSFIFVLPAVATLFVAWPAAWRAARPAATDGVPTLAIVVPLLVFAFALAPMLLLLYPALGTDAWPIITAVSALCLLGLAPMLRRASARDVRSFAWLGLGVTVVGCGVALLCPAYSGQMPQRTLLWYVLDADAGRARWVLQPDSKSTPPQLALHDDPATLESALPAGIVVGVHRAAAPKLDYAAPELQLLDAMATERGTVYRVRLRSPRGAPELELALPDGHATSASLLADGERRLPVKFWRAANHTLWLQLIGAPAEGVVLEIEVPEAQVLVSDFDRFHAVLNRAYLERSQADADRHDRLDQREGPGAWPHTPALRARIEASWERIFGFTSREMDPRYHGPPEEATRQAVFWELRREQVLGERRFVAR